MNAKVIRSFSGITILLLWIILGTKAAAQTKSARDTVYLKMAIPIRVFDDLTRKDAQLAIDMWTREIVQSIAKTTSKHFAVSSTFLKNKYNQVDFSENKKFDVLLLSALDFLDFHLEGDWQPLVLTGSKEHFPEEYLILCRKESNIKNIRDLKGKDIIFSKNQNARIILFWLHYLFHTKHLGKVDRFFHSQQIADKESKAVLSVFFNKNDACIVGYNCFQTMAQLNPQIKRKLQIIQKSPPFARGVVCVKRSLDPEIKRLIRRAILLMPKSQRGKQILTYFGQSKLLIYDPKYLDTFRKILQAEKKSD